MRGGIADISSFTAAYNTKHGYTYKGLSRPQLSYIVQCLTIPAMGSSQLAVHSAFTAVGSGGQPAEKAARPRFYLFTKKFLHLGIECMHHELY